jgi:hypothetical protein
MLLAISAADAEFGGSGRVQALALAGRASLLSGQQYQT